MLLKYVRSLLCRVIFLSILVEPHMHVEISLPNSHRVLELKVKNKGHLNQAQPTLTVGHARRLEYNLSYY